MTVTVAMQTGGMFDTATQALDAALLREAAAGPVGAPVRNGLVSRGRLFGRLERAGRVALVSTPAGSGKTALLRSWIGQAGLADRAAWVSAGREPGDPRPFWARVADALRGTGPGGGLVRPPAAGPDGDGRAVVEGLLDDLGTLREQVWLIVDDLHELDCDTTLDQLELLVRRGPPQLRIVLAARHGLRLGLHQLRLEGELTELSGADLRFTTAEARALLDAAGARLADPPLASLVERTEGWAAGLRLAALSLAGHGDPDRFAAEFCGSERTVAEYLLAEVLDRQSDQARRLLLRTSVLERVNGELADLLTGDGGGERILQELEAANAFVVSQDAARSWFRCHRLFADLLRFELRRTAPDEVTDLHKLAARWFADRGLAVEAARHAQAARDWELAARLLADHWPGLHSGGQDATVHALLAGVPAQARAADAEVAALTAADELVQGSLEVAERYLEVAARGAASVPASRRGRQQVLVGVARLLAGRQRGNLPAVAEQARQLQVATEAPDAVEPGLGEDLRALALINLGITEVWTTRFDQARWDLGQGVALARRIGRPFLEFTGLAYQAPLESRWSLARATERGLQAVRLAQRHGWTDDPAAGVAYVMLANSLLCQGRPEEAERWVRHAERTVRPEAEPATGLATCFIRGQLELARGRDQEAVAAFTDAERLAGHLVAPHLLTPQARARLLQALVRAGDTERAEQALAGLEDHDRDHGEVRIATAALRLAQRDPRAAAAALAPVLDGSSPVSWPAWLVEAFLLEALAQDAAGDPAATGRGVERALDLAEPDRALAAFVLHPAPGPLQRHAADCGRHQALVAEILGMLPGQKGGQPLSREKEWREEAPEAAVRLAEPLSPTERRVLSYLPTNLPVPDIARELCVSANTVKTHTRHLFTKLDAHSRAEAVTRARALGLLTSPQPGPELSSAPRIRLPARCY